MQRRTLSLLGSERSAFNLEYGVISCIPHHVMNVIIYPHNLFHSNVLVNEVPEIERMQYLDDFFLHQMIAWDPVLFVVKRYN